MDSPVELHRKICLVATDRTESAAAILLSASEICDGKVNGLVA